MRRKLKRKNFLFLVLIIFLMVMIFFIIIRGNKMEINLPKLNYTEKSVFPDKVFDVPVFTELIDESKARPMTKRFIKYIVIHETDNFNKGVGASNHANYLKYNNTSPTSWHYTVDDHEIYHHIPDNEVAHHSGDRLGNLYGIGIELCVNSDGDFNETFVNGAKLVAYLLKEYNLKIDDIKTHHDFTGKDCPHNILKNNRLAEFKDKVEYYLEKL